MQANPAHGLGSNGVHFVDLFRFSVGDDGAGPRGAELHGWNLRVEVVDAVRLAVAKGRAPQQSLYGSDQQAASTDRRGAPRSGRCFDAAAQVRLRGRVVGGVVSRTLIIAEVGVNHDGSLEKALELVRVGASAGADADAVKFQTFDPAQLVTDAAPRRSTSRNAPLRGRSERCWRSCTSMMMRTRPSWRSANGWGSSSCPLRSMSGALSVCGARVAPHEGRVRAVDERTAAVGIREDGPGPDRVDGDDHARRGGGRVGGDRLRPRAAARASDTGGSADGVADGSTGRQPPGPRHAAALHVRVPVPTRGGQPRGDGDDAAGGCSVCWWLTPTTRSARRCPWPRRQWARR